MTRSTAIGYWVASASMDVCCLCAWSALLLQVFSERSYPFVEAYAIFALGSLVSSLCHRSALLSHRVALINAAILTLLGLRQGLSTESGWSATVQFGWTLALWIGGVRHSRRSQVYADVCAHFDLALGWLFGWQFMKMMLSLRDDGHLVADDSDTLIFPFFFFGLVTVIVARNRSAQHKSFMSGYRGVALGPALRRPEASERHPPGVRTASEGTPVGRDPGDRSDRLHVQRTRLRTSAD